MRSGLVWLVTASLWSFVSCTAMIAETYHTFPLSDDGYKDITFTDPRKEAVRTKSLFLTPVKAGDRCRAFYDLAFSIDDNQVKRVADVAVAKLSGAMRLVQSSSWRFSPYPDTTILRRNLDDEARRSPWVGMSTGLVHARRFAPSDGPPRPFVSDAVEQDCYFDVELQYFIKFDAPTLVHILVVDTIPWCGSRLLYDQKFKTRTLDRKALQGWIDGLGIEHDQQTLFEKVLLRPDVSTVQSMNDLNEIRQKPAYQEALKRCQKVLGEH